MRAMSCMTLVLAVTSLGCGGDGGSSTSGLAGVYRVESRARHQPCEGAGEPATKPYPFAYFAVVDDPLINGLYVNALPCTGPERSSCEDQEILFLGKRVGDDEWASGSYQRSPSDSCTHSWHGARVKKTAQGVTLQEEYRAEDRPRATCDGNLPEADFDKGHALKCVSMDVSVGVK